MEHYLDKAFKDYIVEGLKEGFRIGYKGPSCWSAKTNMKSALEQSQVVSRYLQDECAAGRVIGPLADNGSWGADL